MPPKTLYSSDRRSLAFREQMAIAWGRKAVTLVETLICIGIIGVLLAMLLPAVQAARESARRSECANRLRQIALGCVSHEQLHNALPTGGWGYRWHGDPDRGFGRLQPGGWPYNILPFVDQQRLRERGVGSDAAQKRQELREVAESSLPAFVCPSRRSAAAYPFGGGGFVNIDRPARLGPCDFAANVGDDRLGRFGAGPISLNAGDELNYPWQSTSSTGVVYRRSETRLAEVLDGASYTYLVGEKYLDRAHYSTGRAGNDDQGAFVGYDRDTLRATHPAFPPGRDARDGDSELGFGSAHPNAFQMAFCDGSVHCIRYQLSAVVHRRLGNRKDGSLIDLSAL